jgi:hypothetical protein
MRQPIVLLVLPLAACVAEPLQSTEEAAIISAHSFALDRPVRAGDVPTAAVCADGPNRCMAHVQTDAQGFVVAHAAPAGFAPGDLRAAYDVPDAQGAPTVAIVDAYGYPNLEADLATYRSTFGLPACTTANGCLKIINQRGQASPLPVQSATTNDWTVEIALDVDMASAVCPSCKLLVVESDDSSDNMYTAVQAALAQNPAVISLSWGSVEQATALAGYEAILNHPGVAIFASSGDSGYNMQYMTNAANQGPQYPATSQHVIAVGGTALARDSSPRGWNEVTWSYGGSSCSQAVPKPAYQPTSPCAYRVSADISAVADPQTGVAVYNQQYGGWLIEGGTSAASPLVASMFAAVGMGAKVTPQSIADNAASLHDVTSGANGTCGNILCTAGVGWDGPTGFGTPDAKLLAPPQEPPPPPPTDPGSGSGSDGGGSTSNPGEITGGCNAGGGASGGMMIALGSLLARRRRR